MKKILYLISKKQDDEFTHLLSSPVPSEHCVSAIFIQQGIGWTPNFPFPCFSLGNDQSAEDMTDSCSKIQYSDMLRMIFEADTVISI